MSKTRRKNKHRMSVLHEYEFSPTGHRTLTKNKRKHAEKLACRNNKAGKFKNGWNGFYDKG